LEKEKIFMKKAKIVLGLLVLLLTLGLVLAGCDTGTGGTTDSGENNNGSGNGSGGGDGGSSSGLAGTNWEAGSGEYLYFLSESTWARYSDSEGLVALSTMSTYSRSGNTITFNLRGGGTSTGTISGNTIHAFGRSYTKILY
jgi:ABC-type oligopeptide transport system substrate-binding subunit